MSLGNQPLSELTQRFPSWTAVPDGCLAADGCAYEAIIVDVPISLLKDMAAAPMVTGDAAGTRFEMTSLQREQLKQFVQAVAGR